ncbi:hypothetical protein BCR43DRAFT_232423 [Syncephalastrum racemosum]|uniref:Uncharacterized protein n=1 Tax=Syncephalastrum racemosum TaxID=13706 RepID=A0A1X2HE10_SYNRA|nr:hypothetical protein BCR43DRAFT_232423 [Syncephalastrum racemosum]
MAHRDVVDGVVVAATVLYGAILYLAGELVCRCVMKKIDAVNRRVRYAKIAMASSMFIKTAFFIALLPSLNSVACAALSHIADFFYHMAMTAGAIVLLSRIRAVTPRNQMTDNGVCIYLEVYYWGPVYTLVDTAIDFYVTCMIGYRLLAHIRMLQRSRQTQGSVGSCVVVVIQNVIRTTILTLVNLMSAILIIFVRIGTADYPGPLAFHQSFVYLPRRL